jgi:hypothetical protein
MAPLRALRILLALLLLSAQQAALSHAMSHLDPHGLPDQERLLCDQHDALGAVAGALDCPAVPLPGAAPADLSFHSLELPSAAAPRLAPSSRGPPTLP